MNITFVQIAAGMSGTSNGCVAIVDSVRPTVFFIDPEKRSLVKYFSCTEYVIEPSDIAVNDDGWSFVTDFKVSHQNFRSAIKS